MNTQVTPEAQRTHEGRDLVIAASLIGAISIGAVVASNAAFNYFDDNFHPGQNIGNNLGVGNKSAEVNSQLESGLMHIDLQIPAFDIQNRKTDK
jgi:hypothetical protein